MLSAWLWSLIPTFVLAVPMTTAYLHRTVTHRALALHPFAEWWCKFFNWITTGVDPAVWAAVHRKHHAYSDIEVGLESGACVPDVQQLGGGIAHRRRGIPQQSPRPASHREVCLEHMGIDRRLGVLGSHRAAPLVWLGHTCASSHRWNAGHRPRVNATQ